MNRRIVGSRAGRLVGVLALVGTACVGVSDERTDVGGPRTGGGSETEWAVTQVFDGAAWARDAIEAPTRITYRRSSTLGLEPSDFASPDVNIVDGRRVTFVVGDPPDFEVWFFGGSTMFGSGQRDGHTIPSEVVKVARDNGIVLRATNYGVESWVNWQATMRFLEELTLGRRPDLAVFYDGVNELGTASEAVAAGVLDPDRIRYFSVDDHERQRLEDEAGAGDLTDAERRAAVVERASRQYRRGVELAASIGDQCGVETVHFWQPQLTSTAPNRHTQEVLEHLVGNVGEATAAGPRAEYALVLESSPLDVVDLRSVFDGVDAPVFYDWAHTNERGSRLVAEAIWSAIEDRLMSLGARDPRDLGRSVPCVTGVR